MFQNKINQRLHIITDHITNDVLVTDEMGMIQFASKGIEKIFGYHSEELLHKNINLFIPNINQDEAVQPLVDIRRIRDGLIGHTHQVKILAKNGPALPVLLSVNKILIENQLYYINVLQDLSKTQTIESALVENQMRLKSIIETAVDGIITIDDKGKIDSINPAAAQLFGYEAQEVVGQNVRILMPEPHHSQHNQYLDNYHRTGVKKIIGIGREVWGLKKDGQTFPFKLSISEAIISNKKIYTGIIHDLSAEKLAEETQHTLQKEKELGDLKSRFVSLASHEFRTPLSAILSSVSLIDRYQDNSQIEKRSKHIKRIKTSVKTLTNILNDFLSLSKLEENKIQNNPTAFELVSFCQNILEDVDSLAKKGQRIHYIHSGISQVYLDRQLLTNVLNNLLSNAFKYSAENQAVFLRTDASEKWITIEVKDQGMGIPLEEQNQLFDRFFRAKNALNISGTGLGLNIVKKYVDLMQGKINFSSVLNEGTTFRIQLPNQINDEKDSTH